MLNALVTQTIQQIRHEQSQVSTMSDTNTDAVRAMATAIGTYGNTASVAHLGASSSTSQPSGPSPDDLFDGRTITVDRWFDDFEHYIRARSSHKISSKS